MNEYRRARLAVGLAARGVGGVRGRCRPWVCGRRGFGNTAGVLQGARRLDGPGRGVHRAYRQLRSGHRGSRLHGHEPLDGDLARFHEVDADRQAVLKLC